MEASSHLSTKTGLGINRQLSGQLYKYTNVVKGWQQRWFSVDAEAGVLSYYLCEGPGDTVVPGQQPRGEVGSIFYSVNILYGFSDVDRLSNKVLD